MAQPIALEIPPRDARKELLTRLENAPAEHAEALLDAFELIQQAHDAQVFQLLRGLLSAKDHLLETVVRETETPAAIHALRNAIIFGKMMSSVNPDLMTSASTGFSVVMTGSVPFLGALAARGRGARRRSPRSGPKATQSMPPPGGPVAW